MDDAVHLLPRRAESPDADEAGGELLAVLLENNMARLMENDVEEARYTFGQRDGSGWSLIDYIFVSRSLLIAVDEFCSEFVEVTNHAKLKVTLNLSTQRIEQDPVQPTSVQSPPKSRKIRLFNLEKLRELEHTEGLVRLATTTDGFTVQSALQTIVDFVDEYMEEIEVKPSSTPTVPADTLRARREARRTERRIKNERNPEVRVALRKLWCDQCKTWRELRDRDEARNVCKARVQFYESIRNRNPHKAWKIARRKLPGKDGGVKKSATDGLTR
jgi:hypothetical protein